MGNGKKKGGTGRKKQGPEVRISTAVPETIVRATVPFSHHDPRTSLPRLLHI